MLLISASMRRNKVQGAVFEASMLTLLASMLEYYSRKILSPNLKHRCFPYRIDAAIQFPEDEKSVFSEASMLPFYASMREVLKLKSQPF